MIESPSERPSFGAQLRAARQEAGVSIAELARRVGTSRALIHSYEKGAVSPTVTTAGRVLACLGHVIVIRRVEPDDAAQTP